MMEITMEYLALYPDFELKIIGRMLNNAIMFSSNLIAQADSDEHQLLNTTLSRDQRASIAEDTFVYHDFLDEVDQLAVQMTVIALNSLSEKTLKKIIRQSSKFKGDIEYAKIKMLKVAFLSISIDLDKIPEFPVFNEVRCVANSIKHSGYVSEELAAIDSPLYGQLVIGDAVKIAPLALELYYKRIRDFFNILCLRATGQ